ncbi:MAG: B12-binding domain-containing radical SAM protein, partial [Bacteroidota bacterium]
MKKLLLITPPFTQLNTPYPATAYLKGFLNTKDIPAFQMDLGIEVILEIFSREGLQAIFDYAASNQTMSSTNAYQIYAQRRRYLRTIDSVLSFLQGNNPTYARLIATDGFLPQASRFSQMDELQWAFGNMGVMDQAKHLATLYLEDLSDFIIECVDGHFGFSRYAERLGMSANSFDQLYAELQQDPTFIDDYTLNLLSQRMQSLEPDLVCFSVPFPGNLYSAFRCAKFMKAQYPEVKIAMGGGFPNTELRSLKDTRVFEFFDFITLDDGELPIELLVRNLSADVSDRPEYKRTYHLQDGAVFYNNLSTLKDYRQSEVGTPDYSDLLLAKYVSVIEVANPMHSLWSDGRWNKLTMAHGCYWGKCTFCDISLDYIRLYEPVTAKMLADRMEELIRQTGTSGFHFVDEAAPPALMKALALEILQRNLSVTWWTNIRFEKSFTLDLCKLLRASGCIAVSGGLEVASDRLLEVIDKGVTVAQVASVLRNFTEAGIMAHAYLMYGYPTQTVQETVDSLEMVRQLFESGVLQSGFWHQFALTAHSPVGMNPDAYGVTPQYETIEFANNDV